MVLSNASAVAAAAAANPVDKTSAPPPPLVRVNTGSGREEGEEPEQMAAAGRQGGHGPRAGFGEAAVPATAARGREGRSPYRRLDVVEG